MIRLQVSGCIIGKLPWQRGIEGVIVAAVQFLLHQSQAFHKALVMHNFPLAQVAQHILYIGVIRLQQQVLIGCARLLLPCVYKGTNFYPSGTSLKSISDP